MEQTYLRHRLKNKSLKSALRKKSKMVEDLKKKITQNPSVARVLKMKNSIVLNKSKGQVR